MKYLEILNQFVGETKRIINLDQAREDEQQPYKNAAKPYQAIFHFTPNFINANTE